MPRSRNSTLTISEARDIALRAQGLLRRPRDMRTPADVLATTGSVQLDTISVLARSHELVPYARVGAAPRAEVEDAYWGAPAHAFEYFGHAACILPLDLWPAFAFRRRELHRKWPIVEGRPIEEVRARLRDGPLVAGDVGGARSGVAGWWNWSEGKRSLEALYRLGEVAVVTRRNWKRVYDLAERVIPHDLLEQELDDEACYQRLVERSIRALGIGTARDIGEYYKLAAGYLGVPPKPRLLVQAAIERSDAEQVAVDGWAEPAFVDPASMRRVRGEQHRTTLLSPFDSLVWERERTQRLFGFAYKLEAYTPKDQRVHGYFTMPLLAGGGLIGRVDPRRDGRTLVARGLSFEREPQIEAMAAALGEAASWVGCDDVRIDVAITGRLPQQLRRALAV